MNRLPLLLLPLALVATSSAQSIKTGSVAGAPLPKLKQILGAPLPQPGHFQYLVFKPAGFDQVMVDKAGPQMKRIEFTFDRLLAGRVGINFLGLGSKGTKILILKDATGPNAQTRNLTEFTGVGDVLTLGARPWRVFYQEVATLNKEKMSAMLARASSLSAKSRANMMRNAYDWHSKIMLFAPSAVPAEYSKR